MYLAFDIGSKRIGLALGSMGVTPYGCGVLDAQSPDWRQTLGAIIDQHAVAGLVVGMPLVVSGDVTVSQGLARAWIRKLAVYNLPITTVNEAYSSVEAERQLRAEGIDTITDKAAIDARAAVLLLEQFLAE